MPPGKESGEVEYTPLGEQDISHQPNWLDIPKAGGGDPDLQDY